MKKYKSVLYSRVSTEDEGQTLSYEKQMEFKDEKFEIVKIFDDRASGTNIKGRKGFLDMLEYCGIDITFNEDGDYITRRFAETDIEIIIVSSTSRFARNTEDALRLVKALHRNKVRVYFKDLNKFSDSEELEMVLPIYYTLDEQVSKDTSRKVRNGMDRRKGDGYVLGSNKIYGYKLDGKRLIKDDQADMVYNMFKDYIEGMGDRGIAVKYNVPYTTVRGILVNPKYMGYMQYDVRADEPMLLKTDLIEPIISEEMFYKAQEVRSSRNLNKEYMTLKKRPLTSKIVCDCCKKKFHYKHRTQWVCGTKSRREGCDMPIFNHKKIIAYLEKILNSDEYLNAIEYTIYSKLKGIETLDKTSLERQVREIEGKKSKILDLYLDEKIDKKEFDVRNIKFIKEIENLRQDIENVKNHNKYIKDLQKIEKEYKKRINDLGYLLNKQEYDKLFEEIQNVYVVKRWSKKGISAEVDYIVFKGMELLNFNLREYNYNEYLN